jgi:hypothetical protein
MANAIAFFPWLTCRQEVQVGPIQLLPYVRGRAPGDLPGVSQADIDGVLLAYSRIHGWKATSKKGIRGSMSILWRTCMRSHQGSMRARPSRSWRVERSESPDGGELCGTGMPNMAEP